MKGRIEIRPAGIDDLREMYILGRENLATGGLPCSHGWNETNFADILARDGTISLVAVTKKKVVAFLIASIEPAGNDQAATIRWFCQEASRQTGLMDHFLNKLKSILLDKNIGKIIIALPETNSELIEYYRNFGFTDSERFIIMENFLPKKS